jgi:cell wall-associated NlpC family hydrolase
VASLTDILQRAGFAGDGLRMAYAIAMAESGGNARAFNGNANTGDQSYGLFQINMLGGMGPERRQAFGLSSNDDLYDAVKNAQVAYKMSKGGTDWSPWSTFKRGDYEKYLGKSGAEVSGGAAPKGQAQQAEAPAAGDILGAQIAPGLAAPTSDPFAPDSADPFGVPKADPLAEKSTAGNSMTGLKMGASSSLRDRVISYAMQELGTPYAWGGGGVGGASRGFAQGANTVGFDCSSLMMYAFGKAGVDMPRVSWDQLKGGQRTDIANLRPGDLVGWGDGGHVALYLGGGRILEAPKTGSNVRVRALGNGGFDSTAFGVRLSLPGD